MGAVANQLISKNMDLELLKLEQEGHRIRLNSPSKSC